ncbi:hypothetical protein HDU98_005546 [Podochytrium sp. JEL0797]|nr:hypothetical protein HDU98_005546 [Podochytrium sp. JEL0797]
MASAISFFPVEETAKLASLMGCEAAVTELMEKENYDKVYATFAKGSGVLLDEEILQPKDLERAYNLLIAIVSQAKPDDLLSLVQNILGPIVASGVANASLKLKVLSNLFNSLETSSFIRYSVFMAIVQLAAEAEELDCVVPMLAHLKGFMQAWDLEMDDERRLVLQLSNAFGEAEDKILSYEYLIHYLNTYPPSPSYPSQVQSFAVSAVLQSLRLPTITSYSQLLSLPPVVSLKSTHKTLWELLQIFLTGSVTTYNAFIAQHPDFLASQDLDAAALEQKIRLLTLTTLACAYTGSDAQPMPFSAVSKALEIEDADVEEWVVRGIRSGLIDARIAQVERHVLVSRATHREFTDKQWDLLSNRLAEWSNSLKEVLTVLQNAKTVAAVAATQQQQQQ